MVIYIQSRGVAQDNDYRWLQINQNGDNPENPRILLQSINDLSLKPIELIDSQKFSIILLSLHNDYCLLVTGLRAGKERTDFMGRPIRNSVLWVCQKDNENLKIRSLLIQALRGELDGEIDKTIENAGEYGFEVNYDSLKKLSNLTLAIGNNYQNDSSCKIGKNCDSLREELALELESNTLPNKEGLLILVTTIKSASALKETGVWRGLSNRVEFEELSRYNISSTTQSITEKKILWIWVAIASILIIAIAIIVIKLTISQTPQIDRKPQIQEESMQLEEKSGGFLKKGLTSTELPYGCQSQKEIDYFLSPCSLNAKNN